jgi:hypothetical protein
MPKFTIVWTRVLHDGDEIELDEINLRETQTFEGAEEAARGIHSSTNEHILLKIYDHGVIGDRDPIELGKEYFELSRKRMIASMELLKRPIRKRKKKKLQ